MLGSLVRAGRSRRARNDRIRSRLQSSGDVGRGPVEPAQWHRPQGIFVLHGPGIRADEMIEGATLLDIAPTILTLFGLPVGEDMEEKILVNALPSRRRSRAFPRGKKWPERMGVSRRRRRRKIQQRRRRLCFSSSSSATSHLLITTSNGRSRWRKRKQTSIWRLR